MDSLVSSDWLAGQIGAQDLRIVDASYFLPAHNRDARADYEAGHIPGAVFLDLATLRDLDDPRPNMMPPADALAVRMQALGIGDGDRIILYDDTPIRTAARAWCLLRAYGVERVAILDGGLEKWRAEGRPLTSGPEQTSETQFTPTAAPAGIVDRAYMLGNLDGGDQVVDARGADRFAGGGPDAHGVPGGHIPGSISLPYTKLFNEDGSYKTGDALRAEFDAAGVDLDRPLVTTCGSGITACTLLFGAHLLGSDEVRLYDGSWSEWGADPETPKVRDGR